MTTEEGETPEKRQRLEAALDAGRKFFHADVNSITVFAHQGEKPNPSDLSVFMDETLLILLGREKAEEVSEGKEILFRHLTDPETGEIADMEEIEEVTEYLIAILSASGSSLLDEKGRLTILMSFIDARVLFCFPREIREFIKEKSAIRRLLAGGNPAGPENASLN